MNYVKKEELTGFRSATRREREWITVSVKREIRRELRPISFWLAVCAVIAGSLLLSLLTEQQTPGYAAVSLVMLLGSVWGVWELRKARSRRKLLLRELENGAYSIMDCRAYDIYFTLRSSNSAFLKVQNLYGQYCTAYFRVRRELGRLCQGKPAAALLLVKFNCDDSFKLIERDTEGEDS